MGRGGSTSETGQQERLEDGRRIALRPIQPDDEERLEVFHSKLSPETIRRRYFTPHPHLTPAELHRFTHVDGSERLAIVAVCDGELVGVGRYESIAGTRDAEGAWIVRDDHQGLGLGTLLARAVADEARGHGKRRLIAETLADNIAMRRVLLNLGLPADQHFRDGIVEIVVELEGGMVRAACSRSADAAVMRR